MTDSGTAPADRVASTENAPTPHIIRAAQAFAQRVQEAFTREFVFLLVGRTGVGKSSTINQLMGQNVAAVGEFEPQTMEVEEFRLPISNVKFVVIDTPGLCDDIPEKGNDQEYLEKIREQVKSVDCMLFVTQLHDTRVRADERFGIEMITKAFGPSIWHNCVIVFTFAGYVSPDKYARTVSERTRLIRETIGKFVPIDIVGRIPSVAIDNMSETTPDSTRWIDELYTTVVERISKDGFVQYLMATAPAFITPSDNRNTYTSSSSVSYAPSYTGSGSRSGSSAAGSYMEKKLDPTHQTRISNAAEKVAGVPTAPSERASFFQAAATFLDKAASKAKAAFQKVTTFFKSLF